MKLLTESVKDYLQLFYGNLRGDLKKARIPEHKYIEKSLKQSGLVFVVFLFLGLLVFDEFLTGFTVACVFGLCTFLLKILLPKIRKKQIAEQIEKHLPHALMKAAVEINLGIAFEKIIKNLANSSYGLLSEEFKKADSEIREGGCSVEQALRKMTEKVDSDLFRRSIYQMVSAYQLGRGKKSAEPLKRIAKEIFLKQHTVLKKFSSQLVVFSLLFIAVSAILPAFVQGMMILGSSFMEKLSIFGIEFNALETFLLIAVVFPALDVLILLMIKAKTPVVARGA